jgi:hypothetical protein
LEVGKQVVMGHDRYSHFHHSTRGEVGDILARFFPRSASSREDGLSVGELESSGLIGAIIINI